MLLRHHIVKGVLLRVRDLVRDQPLHQVVRPIRHIGSSVDLDATCCRIVKGPSQDHPARNLKRLRFNLHDINTVRIEIHPIRHRLGGTGNARDVPGGWVLSCSRLLAPDQAHFVIGERLFFPARLAAPQGT